MRPSCSSYVASLRRRRCHVPTFPPDRPTRFQLTATMCFRACSWSKDSQQCPPSPKTDSLEDNKQKDRRTRRRACSTKCVPPGNSSTANATRASAAATAASSAACAASTLAASASEAEIICGANAVASGRQPPHQQRRLAAMKGASSNCGAFPERVCLCCNQPLCASSSHQKAASETPGACAPPARACGQALKKRAL